MPADFSTEIKIYIYIQMLKKNDAARQTSEWILYFDVSSHRGTSSENLHYTDNLVIIT